MKESLPPRSSRLGHVLEHTFMRFGSGATLYKPLTTARWWNRASWILIIFGIIGWIFALWRLRGYADSPNFVPW